jgi:hypothetical protein
MKFRSLLLSLILILTCGFSLQAQDTIDHTEGKSYILYSGTVDMSAATDSTYTTDGVYVASANQGATILNAVTTAEGGTHDVDLSFDVSHDGSNWYTITPAEITALGTTRQFVDASSTELSGSIWLRVRIAADATNTAETVEYSLFLEKNARAADLGSAQIRQ